MVETGIQWLEEFDANSTFDTSPLAAPDEFRGLPELQDGWERFSAMVPLMESLVRDDGLYLAALRLRASLEAHWTCIHCALQGDDPPMHPSPEPESWQVLDWSIRIEAGLLQAVRACEGLLGQPNAGEPSARTLSRWRDAVDLDPEAPFLPSGKSMVGYYADLFSTARNGAAHGFDGLPFDRVRQECVDAQHFAWRVTHGRFLKVARDADEARSALQFNASALGLVSA